MHAYNCSNPRVDCQDLPIVDLSPWKESVTAYRGGNEYKAASAAGAAAASAKAAAKA